MKKISIYLAITFGLTWSCWGLMVLFVGLPNLSGSIVAQGIIAGSMFFPLVGTILTKLILKKREYIGLKFKPNFDKGIRFYLAAWFTPAIFTLIGCVLYYLMFPGQFDPTFAYFRNALAPVIATGQLPGSLVPLILAIQIVAALTIAPLINMIFAMGEETGWRGFLFPSLCEHMSQRSAVIVSGCIWGLWHAPIICLGHNYGTAYAGYPVLGIVSMCIFCVFAGSFLSYLTFKTDSIWPAALGHGAINAIAGVGIYFMALDVQANPLLGPAPTGLIAGIPLIALGIFCWFKLSGEKPSKKIPSIENV